MKHEDTSNQTQTTFDERDHGSRQQTSQMLAGETDGKRDNYETWLVARWIAKTDHSRLYWLEQARKAKAKAEDWWPDGNRTEEDQAVITIGERLQEHFFEEVPRADPSMPSQFMLYGLRHVEWFDIARSLLAEAEQLGPETSKDMVTDKSASTDDKDSGNADLRPSDAVLTSIRTVLDYLWDDERRDYRARSQTDSTPHVFQDLQVLHCWLVEQKMLRGE